jgi:steroid delta-isomerase-like uncharacterized protein
MSANRELLDRYVELYNEGDLDACMKLYAEDALQRWPDGRFEGRSAIRERLAQDVRGIPDAKYIVETFIDHGDLFADEWTLVGTHTGVLRMPDGREVPPTGRHIEVSGMEFVEVRDGKIVVDNLYYDLVSVAVQVGLLPQGAAA